MLFVNSHLVKTNPVDILKFLIGQPVKRG